MSGHRWAGEVILLPLAEMVARIEAARMEDADPICPTCGSATPKRPERKWCPACQQMLAVARFSFDRSRNDGRSWACKDCRVKSTEAYRVRVAKAGGRMARAS